MKFLGPSAERCRKEMASVQSAARRRRWFSGNIPPTRRERARMPRFLGPNAGIYRREWLSTARRSS